MTSMPIYIGEMSDIAPFHERKWKVGQYSTLAESAMKLNCLSILANVHEKRVFEFISLFGTNLGPDELHYPI